ncbi:MAG TPA: hypothetical protein ENK18_16695 [Deltaproteobacteria bacterium]|nr:hypothetical protein [Deltaproteobacteria bacterium]
MKPGDKGNPTDLDVSNLSRDQLVELIEMQKAGLQMLQSEVANLRTTREIAADAGADAAQALGRGAALATIGQGNEMARDKILEMLGESAPSFLQTEVGREAMLALPPALMLLAVDLGPKVGLPVPDAGRDLVRGAAIVGLEHAGMKNTQAAMKAVWETLAPLFAIYMLGGQQLQSAGALPRDLSQDLQVPEERSALEPAVEEAKPPGPISHRR